MHSLRRLVYLTLSLLCLGALAACNREAEPPVTTIDESPVDQGRLTLTNTTVTVNGETPPGLSNDWLTMSHIAEIPVQAHPEWENLKMHQSTTLKLTNTGAGPLRLTRITLSPAAPFALERPKLPLVLEPGASYDLSVTFTEERGEKGVRSATLNLTTDSAAAPTTVHLAGLFMNEPEGNDEVTLQQVVDAFGYTTDVGLQDGRLSEESSSPLAGDEVRAKLWQRASPDKPVYIRELAAYHGCCNEENFIRLVGPDGENLGEVFHAASYAQSVFPLASGERGPAEMTLSPDVPFEIVVGSVGDSYSTDTDENLGVRLWPVKDRDEKVIPDAYIIAEDYVRDGCGQNSANCDYQDNIFLITNVQPVAPEASPEPPQP